MTLDRIGVRRTLAALVALPLAVVGVLSFLTVGAADQQADETGAQIAAIGHMSAAAVRLSVVGELALYSIGNDPGADPLGLHGSVLMGGVQTMVDDELAGFRDGAAPGGRSERIDRVSADLAAIRVLHNQGEPIPRDDLLSTRAMALDLVDEQEVSLLLGQIETAGLVHYQDVVLALTLETEAGVRLLVEGRASIAERSAYRLLSASTDVRVDLAQRSIAEHGDVLSGIVADSSALRIRGLVDELPTDGPAQPFTPELGTTLLNHGVTDTLALRSSADQFRADLVDSLESERSGAVLRRNLIIGAVPITLLFVAIATGLIGLRLMRRLQTVSTVADQVSGGELDVEPIDDRGNDGISRLARAIDGMTGTLSVVQRQLSALADERFDDEALELEVPGSAGRDLRSAVGRVQSNTSRLREWADRDSLTGLMNRRALERELSAATPIEPGAGTTQILVIDLDGFKEVNDSLGHAAGDEVLLTVTERIEGLVRGNDLVARLGGDEFVIVTFGETAAAAALADRLVDALAEPVETSAATATIGASLGWTSTAGGEAFEPLIRRADEAMYRAKRAGKGQVVRADSDLLT